MEVEMCITSVAAHSSADLPKDQEVKKKSTYDHGKDRIPSCLIVPKSRQWMLYNCFNIFVWLGSFLGIALLPFNLPSDLLLEFSARMYLTILWSLPMGPCLPQITRTLLFFHPYAFNFFLKGCRMMNLTQKERLSQQA
jgi:hypothetical protein